MSARIRPSLLRFRSLLWVLSAVLVTPLPAPAEPLSLTGALELARDNNPSLRQSAARRRAAEAGLSEARRSRLPAVELREIALRTDSPADAFGLQLMQERFSFPEFVNTDPNRPAALNNYAAEIEAQMPLFTGGRLSGGIRQAGAMARAAGDAQRHAGSAVELAVTGAYLNAQLADRAAALARRARETTSRHVEQAQAFFAAGMIVESDLLQAKVQLARMEEGAITAANDSVLARAALNRALGLEQDRQWELDPAPPDPPLPATNLEEALAGARDRRADLQAARENARAAEAGITVARGALLPEIGLSAKASFNDGKIFGSHGSSTTLLAVARWTPWDWGKGLAGLARSRAERTAADEAVRESAEQVAFEVRQAWQGVEAARARSHVAEQAVGSAEKALSILEARFSQGVSRMTDLLDAETSVHEAQVRDVQARYDVQRAIRTLYFAVGLSPVPEVAR